MKKVASSFCLAALAAVQALPLRAEDVAARSLAATCTGCHGPAGVSAGEIPSLAGMKKETLLEKLRAFRDGTRTGTIMPQHAKGYSAAQLDAIAGWFAAQGR